MNDQMGCVRKRLWSILRDYKEIYLAMLRTTAKGGSIKIICFQTGFELGTSGIRTGSTRL
jgi:hypothetical protein